MVVAFCGNYRVFGRRLTGLVYYPVMARQPEQQQQQGVLSDRYSHPVRVAGRAALPPERGLSCRGLSPAKSINCARFRTETLTTAGSSGVPRRQIAAIATAAGGPVTPQNAIAIPSGSSDSVRR